jgi:hypothetical protein
MDFQVSLTSEDISDILRGWKIDKLRKS